MRRIPTLLVVFTASCVQSESQDQVKDLRVLAIKTTPPEILYNLGHTLTAQQRPPGELGPYSIKVEALVVDPFGRDVTVSFRLCPDTRDDACPGYHIRSNAANEQISAMTPLVAPVIATSKADLLAAGEVAVPAAWLDFNDAAMDYLTPHDVNGRASILATVNPALPSFVVRASVAAGSQEISFHRFMLEADLWSTGLPPPLAQSVDARLQALVGFPRCTAEQEAAADLQWQMEVTDNPDGGAASPSVQCVRRRYANHNPHIERVLYATFISGDGLGGGGGGGPGFGRGRLQAAYLATEQDPTSGGEFVDFSGPLLVKPGDPVTIRAVPSSGSHEHYQQFDVDSITGKITASEHDEDLAFAWYTTAGSIQRTTSDQGNADTQYTVGMDTPDGPAFVWVIVRDQRGGVEWRRIEFQVKSDAAKLGGPSGGGPFGGGGRGGG